MPAAELEVITQEPQILLIAEDSLLSHLLVDFFKDQQLRIVAQLLISDTLVDQVIEIIQEHELYKVVIYVDSFRAESKFVEIHKRLADLLELQGIPQVYLINISSKVDATSPLFKDWIYQCKQEDELISYLYKPSFLRKIFMSQDLISEHDLIKNSLSYPLKFLIQTIPNGYLLDPGQAIFPQTEQSFFNVIKKELIRPEKNNFIVRGRFVLTNEVCSKIRLIYQSFYQKDLEILKTNCNPVTRLEKKQDLIEVTAGELTDKLLEQICRDAPQIRLGVDPKLLEGLVKSSQGIGVKTIYFDQGQSYEEDMQTNDQPGVGQFSQRVAWLTGGLSQGGAQSANYENPASQDRSVSVPHPLSTKSTSLDQSTVTANPTKQTTNIAGPATNPTKQATNVANQTIKTTNQLTDFQKANQKNTGDNVVKTTKTLDQQVSDLFTKSRTQQKTTRRSNKVKLIGKIKKKSKRKQVIFIIGALLLAAGILFFAFLGSLNLNYKRSQDVLISNLQIVLSSGVAMDDNQLGLKRLPYLERQATLLGRVLDIHLVDKSLLVNEFNSNLLDLYTEIHHSQQLSAEIFQHLFSQEQQQRGSRILELIAQKETSDKLIYEKVSLLQAEIDGLNPGFFEVELQNTLIKAQAQIKELRTKNLANQQLGSVLPELLGFDQKRVYYLLLQDDRELRPTGGFIQAVVALYVEEGRVADHRVFSTDYIDSKIFGRLNAPAEVVSFLGEESFFFRDANWDPDFYHTSQQIFWFLKEALNQPADGIIGINYSLIRDMLAVTGSVELENYDGTVDAWSLYNRLEAILAEEKDQETAGQFQTALLLALVAKMENFTDEDVVNFYEVLFESLRNQQTLVYLENSSASNVINQLGWSGTMAQPQCPSGFVEDCVVEQIFQVEANIGVNKVNPYINQSVAHKIEIQDNQVVHQRQIKYSNKARSSTWPLGPYKFYLRFYISQDARLEDLVINGISITEEKILNYLDHSRKVFGVVAEVLPEEELEILFHYSTPQRVVEGQSYFFLDQLQAGLKKRPTVISLRFPESMHPKIISPQVDVNQNQIVVTSDVGSSFVVVKFE